MLASSRRSFLRLTGSAATAALLAPRPSFGATPAARGAIAGNVEAAKVGEKVLADGGNAIDAAIASAFAACVCSPHNCGLGGYGGHAIIGLAGGKKITAIDFNSTAPAAARPDMFPLDANGRVKGNANSVGWLAAGVPGTLAGLELALTRYGTRSLRDTLAPAIALCEQGTHAVPVKGVDDAPLAPGYATPAADASLPREKQRNAAQLRLLRTIAARNSADSFYRGDLAVTLADSFKRHGGLVTKEDLAAFRARELAPVSLECFGHTVHAAPLPASSALVLEALAIVARLDLPKLDSLAQTHAKLEALRIAWADRLATWGDPDFVAVPLEKFLSPAYLAESADKVRTALREQKPVPLQVDPNRAGGTINLSASDVHGNMIAITLTHGGGYGARVVVPEFGMFLGHGMSRFDPRPGLPNSVAPRKRPITNMCPALVTRAGTPVFVVGGAGGTRIPSNVFEVLAQTLAHRAPLDTALATPRIDTTGTLEVGLAKGHGEAEETYFRRIGFKVKRTPSATVGAATFDPVSRATAARAFGVGPIG